MVDLMLVDRDDEDTVGLKESLCEPQSAIHEGQPLAVPPLVVLIDVAVVVLPISSARIVRRVDVDAVDRPLPHVDEHLEGVEVFTVYECVEGLAAGVLNPPDR